MVGRLPAMLRTLALALVVVVAAQALAAEPKNPAEEAAPTFDPSRAVLVGGRPPKPHLALVLSGGGARGAAHIGVLKVLEELHIKPDLIVGTSMGSIVGGLYAAGYTPEEIENALSSIDWGEIFVDRIPRTDRSFRRKQDDFPILIPFKLRFQGWRPYIPKGILGGQNLEFALRSLVRDATDARDFNELPIPYRAVAADIETGEAVVIGEGQLSDAMRASMSIAGAFPPVVIAGRTLVDGGAVANVPIGIAQMLGAERVIAVDISSPLSESLEKSSFLDIMSQLSGMLTVGNRAVDVARLREGDVLIRPDLRDISFTDFKRAREAVAYGEAAAREHVAELSTQSIDSEQWAMFRERHHRRDLSSIQVQRVRLENSSWVDDRIVERRLNVETGVPLDNPKLMQQLKKLYALDYFGIIRDDLAVEGDKGTLTVTTPRKPYSRNSLQFGLSLESDLQTSAVYSVTARHTLLAANRRGGEWMNVVQAGNDIVLSSEFYQPLDWSMRWFVLPAISYMRGNQDLWLDGQPVAKYGTRNRYSSVEMGRVFRNWGEATIGVFRGYGTGFPQIGLSVFPHYKVNDGGFSFTLRADTEDTVAFPTRGTRGGVRVERSLGSFGADETGTWVVANISQAFTRGRNTFSLSVQASTLSGDLRTLQNVATLGGFLRLSGLGTKELIGEEGGVARVVYYRDLVWLKLGALSNRVVVGMSLESGNVYQKEDPITWSSLRYGGAVFVGADTVIGPAYFGWGWTEPNRSRLYFVFGQRF